jgi:hypothetical protein
MSENPYTELSDAEFLRYLAQNEYNIDGKYLPEGVNLFAVADRIDAAKTHYADLAAAFDAVKADYARIRGMLEAYERPVFVFDNGEPIQIEYLEDAEPNLDSAAERYKNGQDAMKRLAELDEELGLQ